jgi:hypothetical protein
MDWPDQVPDEAPEPEYSEDGVDLTLIRWALSMSPAERLHALEQQLQAIEELREGIPQVL